MFVNALKQNFEKIAKKYELDLLLLFGSQVKNKKYIHQESDFDIAFATTAKKELNGKELIDLNCDLIDIFNCDRIDMVNLKNEDPFLRQEIAKNSQLLFGDEMDYLEFKAFAFRDYIDHQSLFDLQDILMKKRHQLLGELIYGK
ncbi:hypothetical protein KKA09_02080 [Patescibacteria group bacterium]|nr:hypothetical protein [Patescibacteria group bacterium]